MLPYIDVPPHLHRNSPKVLAAGIEETGQLLIDLATSRMGLPSLASSDILDIGCGVRFTQTIVNRRIPIRSYTGVEVHRPIVDFLKETVEPFDPRFRFIHWDVYNAMFNPGPSPRLESIVESPAAGSFDVIWLFSVFTHLDERDARAMLRLLRRSIRPDGSLLFTAFIDPELEGFEDRKPESPLLFAHFGKKTMEQLIRSTGWVLRSFHDVGSEPFIQPCFVCSPDLS
jgi:SAM-dependent methyltransferase